MEVRLALRAILLSDELIEDKVKDVFFRTAFINLGEDLIITIIIKTG